MEGKPWYLSKTLWGLAIAILGLLLPKLPISDNAVLLTDSAMQIAGGVANIVGVALATYGTITRKGPLTK